MTQRDRALEQLTSEFPRLSARVVVAMFVCYLERTDTVADAVRATRARILDACAAA